MIRFTFTPHAEQDIDGVATYLQSLPKIPVLRMGREIQDAIKTITEYPAIGHVYQRFTRQTSKEVRRFVTGQYVIFYNIEEKQVCFLGFLHGSRDIRNIMRQRLE